MHGKIWGDIMKNSKGFTVVELLVSFSLTMIIAVFLFEVLIEVKDIFADAATRTAIQEKASIISKNIDNILAANDNRITCNNSTNLGNCQINGKSFRINKENNQIIVDGQKFDMPETVSIKNYSIQDSCDGNNCYLHVQMTLESGNLTKDYDYDVTYYFTANPTEIPGATFKESGTNPKIVTITYPDGCGDKYICTYNKDNGQTVTVNEKTADVEFTNDGILKATVSDGRNSTVNSYNVEVSAPIDLKMTTSKTTNSITVVANATSSKPITKYWFSIDGEIKEENNGTNNTYKFTNLKADTEYEIVVGVSNGTSNTESLSLIRTNKMPKPTFEESGNVPKTVTITYPEGCGTTYTCTYQKNNEQQITVTSQIANVNFNESGNILATVSDGINNATETYNVDVPQDSLSVTLSNTHTTNSITAIANVTSVSRVTKYEFSIDGQKWQESNINTYEFTGLKNNTEYTIMTRITNATGKTATASQKVTTSDIPIPTFTQSGVYPLTVKITFPEGCGTTYTCTYQQNSGEIKTVTTKEQDVIFYLEDVNNNYQGSVAATVSDGTNTQRASHTAKIKLRAVDLSYDNSKTGMDCVDAQCAIDTIDSMFEES